MAHRHALYVGKYVREPGSTMSDYACERYTTSVYYEPPLLEQKIVELLIGHFPPRVSLDLQAREIQSIDELTRQLDRLEVRYNAADLDIYGMGDSRIVERTELAVTPTAPAPRERSKKKRCVGRDKRSDKKMPPIPEKTPSRDPSPARSVDSVRSTRSRDSSRGFKRS